MPGLAAYSVAGVGFLLLSAIESLPVLPSAAVRLRLRFISTLALSLLALLSSLLSISSPHDPFAVPLALSSAAAAALFALYAVAGLLPLHLPPSLQDLIAAFAFAQELLLFGLRRKDPDGIENRYFDLHALAVLACVGSSALAALRPRDAAPRLARAAALALQGTWFIQMGFSFFSTAIAHGCQLHERSRGDYTIKCRTHDEYHRARAIATLQFNGHLALLLIAGTAAVAFTTATATRGPSSRGIGGGYQPLGKEMQMGIMPSQFTLDSDDDDVEEIVVHGNGQKADELHEVLDDGKEES